MPSAMAVNKNSWTPKRIEMLRKRLLLTQEQAAELVGITRRQWAAWEGGTRKPSGPAIILLDLLDQRDGKI